MMWLRGGLVFCLPKRRGSSNGWVVVAIHAATLPRPVAI